jgi:hypothetical protein
MSDTFTADQFMASAVKFLIEGGDEDAASLLLACQCDVSIWQAEYGEGPDRVSADLICPRVAYDHLSNQFDPIHDQVWKALEAITPRGYFFLRLDVRAELLNDLGPDWQTELFELLRGGSIHNQAVNADNAKTWNGFRFRSVTETHIADALDRAGVLFFPLPKGRLNGPRGRVNREPDFLVCKDGKWGILEVDGAPYHPPQRTVQDHERDRLFLQHGIRIAQHFDATDCFATPDKVVSDFLRLLDKAY